MLPRYDECCKEDLETGDYRGRFVKASDGSDYPSIEENLEEGELVV